GDLRGRSRLRELIPFAVFGDGPVLAKPAAEIASSRAEQQHARSRQKMIQRFLLNGVDAKPAAPAISCEHHSVTNSLPNETESALAFIEFAEPRTQPTLDPTIRQHLPPTPWIIGLSQLCDHWPAIWLRKSELAHRGEDLNRLSPTQKKD